VKTISFDSSFPKAMDYKDGKFLVGMRNGTIFEVDETSEERKSLLYSHHEGEAWGLDIDNENKQIFTCGDDNKVMMFNYEKREFVT
jgi:WD40 repeat protein